MKRVFWISLLCSLMPALAAPQLARPVTEIVMTQDRDRTLAFAQHLEDQGDYYRAITEYKRVDFQTNDDGDRRTARLGIARCYHTGRKWQALEQACQHALELKGYSTRDHTDLSVARALALWNLGRAIEAHVLFEKIPTVNLEDADRHLQGWVAVAAGKFEAAKKSFEGIHHETALAVLNTWPPTRKNPTLAGTLSGFLPGAGQLYCGKSKAAAGAFTVNGLLLAGTISAFNDDQEALGIGLALLTLSFWSGNVYGAVNFAHSQNQDNFVERDSWLARNLYLNGQFRETFNWSFRRP